MGIEHSKSSAIVVRASEPSEKGILYEKHLRRRHPKVLEKVEKLGEGFSRAELEKLDESEMLAFLERSIGALPCFQPSDEKMREFRVAANLDSFRKSAIRKAREDNERLWKLGRLDGLFEGLGSAQIRDLLDDPELLESYQIVEELRKRKP